MAEDFNVVIWNCRMFARPEITSVKLVAATFIALFEKAKLMNLILHTVTRKALRFTRFEIIEDILCIKKEAVSFRRYTLFATRFRFSTV